MHASVAERVYTARDPATVVVERVPELPVLVAPESPHAPVTAYEDRMIRASSGRHHAHALDFCEALGRLFEGDQ